MPVIDHFNILAPYYDRVIQGQSVEKLIRLAGLPVEGALLDVGGGTGRVTEALRGLASHLVVADLSTGMLRQALAKGGLYPVCTHSEGLPFPEASFDCVLMVDALHHVFSAADTSMELWRVIKPGGRIVVEEPDIRRFSVKLVALAEKLALMRSHFIAPPLIAGLFTSPQAQASIETESYTAWVVIEKTA
jgi:ubiquinone/menaquinone biosynthesis C-methylase UbiE